MTKGKLEMTDERSVSVVLLFGSDDAEARDIVGRAIDIVGLAVGRIVRCSEEYTTEAYGFTSERMFVNRAVQIVTRYDAYEVLRRINLIEALLGRDRESERRIQREKNEAYASRAIDIDIIFYGSETFSDERLTIPYHFLAERGYALRPVVDVAPDFKHPALERTPEEMLRMLDSNTTC